MNPVQGQKYSYTPHTPIRSKFSLVLLYDELILSCSLEKSAQNDPEVQTCISQGPNFVCFALWWAVFKVMAHFSEKYTEWSRSDLDMFKVKSTHMDTKYTHEVHIFVYLLYNELFLNYEPILRKVKRMTKALTSKSSHIHPRGPAFRPFCFRMSYYLAMAQFSEKCTKWLQKWPWHVLGQKYLYTYHIRVWVQILVHCPFRSTTSRFQDTRSSNALSNAKLNWTLNSQMYPVYTKYSPLRSKKFWSTSAHHGSKWTKI